MFGSTSPSYLILQSLDAANVVLADPDHSSRLVELTFRIAGCRERLTAHGLNASNGNEPLKLTIYPRFYGYTGTELAEYLRGNSIECEFADPDFLVLMFTPAISEADIRHLTEVLTALPRRNAARFSPPEIPKPRRAMSIREAALAPRETLPVKACLGRILAAPSVGCPPAVPILVCGERIVETALNCFAYYGVETCTVVKEST